MLVPYSPQPIQIIDIEDSLPMKKEALSEEGYERLKASFDNWRDTLICKVLKCTGLRAGEVLRTNADLYKLRGPDYYLIIVRSKRAGRDPEYERMYLPPVLGVELRNFMEGNQVVAGQPPFQGRVKGQMLTLRALEYSFERACARAGIHPAVTPHGLRHLNCQVMLDNDVPLAVVSALLGHASERTTLKWYYDLTYEKRRAIAARMKP